MREYNCINSIMRQIGSFSDNLMQLSIIKIYFYNIVIIIYDQLMYTIIDYGNQLSTVHAL